jgi:ribosomal protein S12 methylthiotransferase accessory factor
VLLAELRDLMQVLKCPVFNANYRVLTAGSDTLLLLSESEDILLHGRAFVILAPLIDGHTTSDELVRRVRDSLAPAEAYYVLLHLQQQGLLYEASESGLPVEQTAFLHALGVDPHLAAARLQSQTVLVTALGALDASPLAARLQQAGIRTTAEAADCSFEIVLTDDYLRGDLQGIQEQAWKKRHPWLLVKPVGSTIWIGPLFRPQQPPCWECLAQRLRARQASRELLLKHQNWSNQRSVPQAAAPADLQTVWELLTLEVFKLLVLDPPNQADSSILSVELLTLETRKHTLVPRPQCPFCTTMREKSLLPSTLLLKSQRKHVSAAGGSRTTTPEETLKAFGHHVSPITGLVRQLQAESWPAHPLIHNFVADSNIAFSQSGDLDILKQHLRSRSSGKGITSIQAQVGALCESLERISGIYQGYEPRIQASFAELGADAIHPSQHLLFSEQQYQDRERINQERHSMFQWVPARFDERRVVEWTPLWSLTEQKVKYLPTSCCYYAYPQAAGEAFALADSNGAASGNTFEEAVLQGFFELVERDAVAIWWYNRLPCAPLDLTSFQHPYAAQLQAAYRDQFQRELWVLNLTHDLSIPTFAAISRQVGAPKERLIMGFGTHFNPEIALLRALTEMNQSLPLLAPDIAGRLHSQIANWWQNASVHNQPYLLPDAARPAVCASDFHYVEQTDLLEELNQAQQIVKQKGLEMLVLDQSRPDIGLPVAKVFVPGLRHFWTRFAPGRLYEVPVQINKLSRPLTEAELNPIPMLM